MGSGKAELYKLFADYNRWANTRIYDAAARLSEAQLKENRGAFFKSVLGTLNHILVGDRIWISRLNGAGRTDLALDTVLFEDLGALRKAREAEDAIIISKMAGYQ